MSDFDPRDAEVSAQMTSLAAPYEARIRELESALEARDRQTMTLAKGVLAARDAHIQEDYQEVYHQLYTAATALSDDPYEPWKALEAIVSAAAMQRGGYDMLADLKAKMAPPEGTDK